VAGITGAGITAADPIEAQSQDSDHGAGLDHFGTGSPTLPAHAIPSKGWTVEIRRGGRAP
jgi:hypothetical protein